MSAIRVVVVDDHELVRGGVCETLADDDDIDVVAETGDGSDIALLLIQHRPDVLLLDLRLPGFDTLGCIEDVRRRHSATTIVVLSASQDPATIRAVLDAGAHAYVVKTVLAGDIAAALRQTVRGSLYRPLPREADDAAAGETGRLSARERDILDAVTRGLRNKEIARELWISEPTVKFHLHNIYRKLGVSTRTEAARAALAGGGVGR
jgi:DNA-binding NarL/FixJ family response regulator